MSEYSNVLAQANELSTEDRAKLIAALRSSLEDDQHFQTIERRTRESLSGAVVVEDWDVIYQRTMSRLETSGEG